MYFFKQTSPNKSETSKPIDIPKKKYSLSSEETSPGSPSNNVKRGLFSRSSTEESLTASPKGRKNSSKYSSSSDDVLEKDAFDLISKYVSLQNFYKRPQDFTQSSSAILLDKQQIAIIQGHLNNKANELKSPEVLDDFLKFTEVIASELISKRAKLSELLKTGFDHQVMNKLAPHIQHQYIQILFQQDNFDDLNKRSRWLAKTLEYNDKNTIMTLLYIAIFKESKDTKDVNTLFRDQSLSVSLIKTLIQPEHLNQVFSSFIEKHLDKPNWQEVINNQDAMLDICKELTNAICIQENPRITNIFFIVFSCLKNNFQLTIDECKNISFSTIYLRYILPLFIDQIIKLPEQKQAPFLKISKCINSAASGHTNDIQCTNKIKEEFFSLKDPQTNQYLEPMPLELCSLSVGSFTHHLVEDFQATIVEHKKMQTYFKDKKSFVSNMQQHHQHHKQLDNSCFQPLLNQLNLTGNEYDSNELFCALTPIMQNTAHQLITYRDTLIFNVKPFDQTVIDQFIPHILYHYIKLLFKKDEFKHANKQKQWLSHRLQNIDYSKFITLLFIAANSEAQSSTDTALINNRLTTILIDLQFTNITNNARSLRIPLENDLRKLFEKTITDEEDFSSSCLQLAQTLTIKNNQKVHELFLITCHHFSQFLTEITDDTIKNLKKEFYTKLLLPVFYHLIESTTFQSQDDKAVFMKLSATLMAVITEVSQDKAIHSILFEQPSDSCKLHIFSLAEYRWIYQKIDTFTDENQHSSIIKLN